MYVPKYRRVWLLEAVTSLRLKPLVYEEALSFFVYWIGWISDENTRLRVRPSKNYAEPALDEGIEDEQDEDDDF